MPQPPLRGELEKRTEPLLQLGSTLGEGGFGVVVEAERGQSSASGLQPAGEGAASRLAVKMFRVGGARGHDERVKLEAVMWEVHVLRALRHENIVRLLDVVELADALVYIVMERIEGPDLHEFLCAQPKGRLAEGTARHFFRHMLAAVRHAHGRGFMHGDLKPANVKLQTGGPRLDAASGRMSAVVVDWGLSRKIDGAQPAALTMGTALYACLLYTSPSPRDATLSRMPSSA